GDGGFSNDQNPSHEYADSGSYQVTLHIENRFGCKDTTDHMVRIDPVFVIFIPNSFTPDGDGMNDFFFPSGFGYQEIKMQIYDRWGEVIYEGNSVRSKWDGLYKGSPIKGDSYVYKINIKDVLGAEHEYIGKVTVIQ
ncbi:MAG: gliding motility-associated C-terminal domain-containing protein, partial [Flavobacteriales bacterium]|nr:gliding motility-associated C-terminal domain-containing protein [Flavobacteriales bacterium]